MNEFANSPLINYYTERWIADRNCIYGIIQEITSSFYFYLLHTQNMKKIHSGVFLLHFKRDANVTILASSENKYEENKIPGG